MARISDEEYVYRQDIKEKKSTGRGAFHKKCGSKSKKCTLPSDHMTKKEREAMNGAVFHYDPRKWYTWEEFKTMPMEYQVKYINSLLTRYNCGFRAIAQIVLNVHPSNLIAYFKRRNEYQNLNCYGKDGGHSYDAGRKKLLEDVERDRWPNRDEIQNGIEDKVNPDVPSQEDKIAEAAAKVELYANNGVPMPPERIEEIYQETAGVSIAKAANAIAAPWEENEEVEIEQGPVDPPEDSTDVKSFSIIMDHIDMDIIDYLAKLFVGKKISVSIDVKQVE